MLIFDRFKTKQDAELFAEKVRKITQREAKVYDTQSTGNLLKPKESRLSGRTAHDGFAILHRNSPFLMVRATFV